jgi:hypothetical protein
MGRASGAGVLRVPNTGPLYLLKQVATNVTIGGAVQPVVLMKDARGFSHWTFQLDPEGTTVNATINVYGSNDIRLWGGPIRTTMQSGGTGNALQDSIDSGLAFSTQNIPPAGLNVDNLANWTVNGTGPFPNIVFLGPLVGVYATITNWVSGTISVTGMAVPS